MAGAGETVNVRRERVAGGGVRGWSCVVGYCDDDGNGATGGATGERPEVKEGATPGIIILNKVRQVRMPVGLPKM